MNYMLEQCLVNSMHQFGHETKAKKNHPFSTTGTPAAPPKEGSCLQNALRDIHHGKEF